MKKMMLLAAALISSLGAMAEVNSECIIFEELPYTEGTLYVSVSDGSDSVLMRAVDVESDCVTIPVCLDSLTGKQLSVNAFLDTNGNRQLDFDSYGRPTEPCLKDRFMPAENVASYSFKLIEY